MLFIFCLAFIVGVIVFTVAIYRTHDRTKRPSIILKAAMGLLFACFGIWGVSTAYTGIADGDVSCMSKRCGGTLVSRSDQASAYWLSIGFRYAAGVTGLSVLIFCLFHPATGKPK